MGHVQVRGTEEGGEGTNHVIPMGSFDLKGLSAPPTRPADTERREADTMGRG